METQIVPLKKLPQGQIGNKIVTTRKEFMPMERLNLTIALNYVLRGYMVFSKDETILAYNEILFMDTKDNNKIKIYNEYLGNHDFILNQRNVESHDYYVMLK